MCTDVELLIIATQNGVVQVPRNLDEAQIENSDDFKVMESSHPVVSVAADPNRDKVFWAEDDSSENGRLRIFSYNVLRQDRDLWEMEWTQDDWPVRLGKPGLTNF